MITFTRKKVLFRQKEINGYLCTYNENLYRVYEIKDDKTLHTLLPYQEKWQYEVSLVYTHPIFIFKHTSIQWYIFKEIHTVTIEQRFKICLSFLEKLLLMQATVAEIIFFCDSTNLWFDKECHCELFYKPKIARLREDITKEDALTVLARFLFRHIQLAEMLDDETIYNQEYIAFYKHAFATHYYSSILQIYDEVYAAYNTYYKKIPDSFSWSKFVPKIITVGIQLAIVYIVILYSIYAIGFIKKIYDEQFHDLYTIGNQSMQQSGESP